MCSSTEPVPSEHSSEEDDKSSESTVCIRCKWIADGAQTLDEVIEKLQEYICYIETLKADGYELIDSMDDDYGFVRKVER